MCFLCETKEMCKRRLWKRATLHRGPVAEPGGGGGASFTGDFRQLEGSGNGAFLWAFSEGTWRGGAPLWGTLKEM